jgi:hypothetical protein
VETALGRISISRNSTTIRRAFVAAALGVVAVLATGAGTGTAFTGLCHVLGGYAPCSYSPVYPPTSYYGGYGPYSGSGGSTTPPPVHFTKTPDATADSHTASFDWAPDAPPPPGTAYNYDCLLDGNAVHDDGSAYECHPPKTFTVATGAHTFSVAVVGAHGADGPSATYHWTVVDQAGTSGGGGSPSSGGGQQPGATTGPTATPATADTTPPNVTIKFAGKTLSDLQKILVQGFLRVTISCSEPCTIDITALLDGPAAKRLGIARQVVVGRGQSALAKAGTTTVKVKLTKKARKRLRGAKSVVLTLKTVVHDKSDNTRTTSKRVVLKRNKR